MVTLYLQDRSAIISSPPSSSERGGEGDVLLLYARVYEGSLILVALASTTVLPVFPILLFLLPVLQGKIDADALLEDKFRTLLADTVTKMDKL